MNIRPVNFARADSRLANIVIIEYRTLFPNENDTEIYFIHIEIVWMKELACLNEWLVINLFVDERNY